MIPPEARCPMCDSEVESIEPRWVPQLTTGSPKPLVRVVSRCPSCRVLFAEGEIARFREAMETE